MEEEARRVVVRTERFMEKPTINMKKDGSITQPRFGDLNERVNGFFSYLQCWMDVLEGLQGF